MIQDVHVYQNGRIVSKSMPDGVALGTFNTLKQAVDHAQSLFGALGGEIYIHRGIYPVTEPIEPSANVSLRGAGRSTVLEAQNCDAAIRIDMRDFVSIQGMSIRTGGDDAARAGIHAVAGGCVKIQDVGCEGFEYGLLFENSCFLCTIMNCTAAFCAKAGIYFKEMTSGGRGGDFVPNLITGCTVYGGGDGIVADNSIVLNITSCQIFQATGSGIVVRNVSNSVLVSGCRTFQIEGDAVRVEDSHEINISSNIFCWTRGRGIVFSRVSWGAVGANNVIDVGVRARDGKPVDAIVLDRGTKGISLANNAIFNWGDQVPMKNGIIETKDCENNVISSNNVNYFTGEAVVSSGSGTQVIGNHGVARPAYEGPEDKPAFEFDLQRIEAVTRQARANVLKG